MIEELVAKIFAARNAAHLEHWATKNDARHRALEEFYDEVIEIVDTLVEVYQGNFGRIRRVKLETTQGDTLELLQEQVKWIEANTEEIAQGVGAIQNVLQDLSGRYFRTIFRLRDLS